MENEKDLTAQNSTPDEEKNHNSINPEENIPEEGSAYDYSSVFAYNEPAPEAEERVTFANRDYVKAYYNDEMKGINPEVRYTRSQYIKDFNDLQDSYRQNVKRQILCIAATLGGYALLMLFRFVLIKIATQTYSNLVVTLIEVAVMVTPLLGFLAAGCLIFGFAKQIFKAKRQYEYSVEQLENRKEQSMLAGSYDAGK